jgi:PAS domain S-box-containing protein
MLHYDGIIAKDQLLAESERRAGPTGRRSQRTNVIPKDFLDISPNLILVVSPDGTIREVNKHGCAILKASEGDLIGTSLLRWCIPEEAPQLEELVRASMNGDESLAARTRFSALDGSPVDIDLTLGRYPKSGAQGEEYCVLIGRDISEEKRIELDLLRFSNIAHYTVNPIEITDPRGRIIYVNPAFEKASGYRKEELIGQNPNVFGSGKHPKPFWDKMWKTITSGNVWVGEIENRKRDGEPFFTHLLISPILDAGGAIVGFFGVHRDITGQKSLEQQLIHAQKMESIGLLAAGLAHEVGNPLTSISSLVQVIQRTTRDDFAQEKLELIKSQIGRISKIIRDLVDFSRRSNYEVQLTDVNKCMRDSVEIVRIGKKSKGISFRVELEERLPPLPLVPDQVEQVFINILINAVDAIHSRPDEPGRGADGAVTVRSRIEGASVVVEIQDNGKGIAEDARTKIFEPFYTTKKVGEGTGLGLWVSYGIIKSFQGTIGVDSVEGRGTTFTISLPLHPEL